MLPQRGGGGELFCFLIEMRKYRKSFTLYNIFVSLALVILEKRKKNRKVYGVASRDYITERRRRAGEE